MSNTRLHFAVLIKSKTPRSPSPRCGRPRSTSTTRRLRTDLRRSIGRPVFKNGTSAQSSTARTIRLPRGLLPKRGPNNLEISARHSFSPFFPTKICAESARRSRQLRIPFCFQKSAADAPPIRKNSYKFSLPLLRHSPTPSLHPLLKHWSWHAQN